jgi:hypothetical protein
LAQSQIKVCTFKLFLSRNYVSLRLLR